MSPKINTPTEDELAFMLSEASSCQEIETYELYCEVLYLRLAVSDLRKRLEWSWNCHTNLKQILGAEKDELQKVITWYNKKLDEAYSLLQVNTGFVHHYQKLNETSIAPEWFDTVPAGANPPTSGGDNTPRDPGF